MQSSRAEALSSGLPPLSVIIASLLIMLAALFYFSQQAVLLRGWAYLAILFIGYAASLILYVQIGPRLLPGMLVRMSIVTDRHADALILPKRAIQREGERLFVLAVDAVQAGGELRYVVSARPLARRLRISWENMAQK